MDKKISKVISTFPVGLKFYITSEANVISCIGNLLGDKVTPVIKASIFDEKPSKDFFYTPEPITISYSGIDILIQSFCYNEKWNVILGSKNVTIIRNFLNSFKKTNDIVGYMEFPNSYKGYEYSKGKNVTTGLNFHHLISIEDKTAAVIKDVDSYFANIDKHRAMGVNRGINYVFHGPPGTGKTSFARALAYHYNANLFVPDSSNMRLEINPYLNPSMKGMCIVLIDDFNAGHQMNDYIHAMFDNGTENVIRIFITNNFGNINHTPFISRCRRVFEFKPPSCDTITTLISRALDVTPENARSLADLIELKEKQREAKHTRDSETQLAEYEQLENKENARKPIIKPFERLGYRDLNFFLAEYVGMEDGLAQATNKLNNWIDDRGRHVSNSDSSIKESCCIM